MVKNELESNQIGAAALDSFCLGLIKKQPEELLEAGAAVAEKGTREVASFLLHPPASEFTSIGVLERNASTFLRLALSYGDYASTALLMAAEARGSNLADLDGAYRGLRDLGMSPRINEPFAVTEIFDNLGNLIIGLARWELAESAVFVAKSFSGGLGILETVHRNMAAVLTGLIRGNWERLAAETGGVVGGFDLLSAAAGAVVQFHDLLSKTVIGEPPERIGERVIGNLEKRFSEFFEQLGDEKVSVSSVRGNSQLLDILRLENMAMIGVSEAEAGREKQNVRLVDLTQIDSLEATLGFMGFIGGKMPERIVGYFDPWKLRLFQLSMWDRLFMPDLDNWNLGEWRIRTGRGETTGEKKIYFKPLDSEGAAGSGKVTERAKSLWGWSIGGYEQISIDERFFFKSQATTAEILNAYTRAWQKNRQETEARVNPKHLLRIPLVAVLRLLGSDEALTKKAVDFLAKKKWPGEIAVDQAAALQRFSYHEVDKREAKREEFRKALEGERDFFRGLGQDMGKLRANLRQASGLGAGTPYFPETDVFLDALQEFIEIVVLS